MSIWTFVLIVAIALAPIGCAQPQPDARVEAAKERCLAVARRELVALPLFTDMTTSCFPISARNIITAAHCIEPSLAGASVAGFPARLSPGVDAQKLEKLPFESDWTLLMSSMNRFRPNRVDASITLRKGDIVVIAGFRGNSRPLDALWHATREAEYVVGQVVTPTESTTATEVVKMKIPNGDLHGFSGGPAAIVDRDDHIRVWGVVVGGSKYYDILPPWRRHDLAWIARLPASRMASLQDTKILNPTEWPNVPAKAPIEPGELLRYSK